MAAHRVTISSIPSVEIGASPIVFEIREGAESNERLEKLGELKVSQGRLSWLPSGGLLLDELVLEWSRFAELAKEHGKKR